MGFDVIFFFVHRLPLLHLRLPGRLDLGDGRGKCHELCVRKALFDGGEAEIVIGMSVGHVHGLERFSARSHDVGDFFRVGEGELRVDEDRVLLARHEGRVHQETVFRRRHDLQRELLRLDGGVAFTGERGVRRNGLLGLGCGGRSRVVRWCLFLAADEQGKQSEREHGSLDSVLHDASKMRTDTRCRADSERRLRRGNKRQVAANLRQKARRFRGPEATQGGKSVRRAEKDSTGSSTSRRVGRSKSSERNHRLIDPLLERGDAAFAELPKTEAAAAVVRELGELLAPHLATEEAELIPYLRGIKGFPPLMSFSAAGAVGKPE